MIQLRLDETRQPDLAVYAQHAHAEARTGREVEAPDDHRPIVYVARGSHARYFTRGTHWTGVWFDHADGRARTARRRSIVGDDSPAGPLARLVGRHEARQLAVRLDQPARPGRHTSWRDPALLAGAAARAAAAAKPAPPAVPAAPKIAVRREGDRAVVAFDAPASAAGIVVAVRPTGSAEPARTIAVPAGGGSGEVEVPLPDDRAYDVHASTAVPPTAPRRLQLPRRSRPGRAEWEPCKRPASSAVATWGGSCAPSTGRARPSARPRAGRRACGRRLDLPWVPLPDRPLVGPSSSCSTTTPTGRCSAASTRGAGPDGAEVWPEIWDVIGPMLGACWTAAGRRGRTTSCCVLDRNGYLEEALLHLLLQPDPRRGGRSWASSPPSRRRLSGWSTGGCSAALAADGGARTLAEACERGALRQRRPTCRSPARPARADGAAPRRGRPGECPRSVERPEIAGDAAPRRRAGARRTAAAPRPGGAPAAALVAGVNPRRRARRASTARSSSCRRPDRRGASPTPAPSRPSAGGRRRSPSSTARRRRSSPTSATSSGRR